MTAARTHALRRALIAPPPPTKYQFNKSIFFSFFRYISLDGSPLGGNAVKKAIFLAALILVLGMNVYALEKKAAIGAGMEWNMNARENFAGGALLSFDCNLPRSFAIGLNVTASINFSDITVIEPATFFRWYFLGGHNGFFVQADLGAYLIFENDDLTTLFLGGLRGGFRFPLGKSFYVEPFGRIGYPFAFGVGALAGIKF
jgi:hypothetical protein